MSLSLIRESAREVRRLSVAGSRLAIGDFRLQKLIPPLEQAGASVPVFAQVAKGLKDLVNSSEADSAANLLALSTLLNAILYTQGQTAAQGAFAELPECSVSGASTKVTARALRPIIQALTSQGAGRLEAIKTAIDRGMFKDLRLIHPSIRALEDFFPEIADLVADKILPGYGVGIIPLLKDGFDIKGKKSDARRLLVMHALDAGGTLDLCKKALEEGSADVKIAAIECLGKHEECIPLVLEQANSKNKQVRAATLEALAPHDRAEVVTLFNNLISGKALDLLARPFRFVRNRQIVDSLLKEGSRVFGALVKGDSEQIARFQEILDCLVLRTEPETQSFLAKCLDQSDALAKVKPAKNSTTSGVDALVRLVDVLHDIHSDKALDAILAKRNSLPPASFNEIIDSGLKRWSAAKIFDEFSPLLQRTSANKLKSEAIERCILLTTKVGCELREEEEADTRDRQFVDWDERWLDAAIKADNAMVVSCLARPNHKGCVTYLAKALEKSASAPSSNGSERLMIRSLARCQYPKVTDAFLALVAKRTKGAKYLDYHTSMFFKSACWLPKADLPRLDEFASKMDEKFVDHFLEALQPLRESAQAAQLK